MIYYKNNNMKAILEFNLDEPDDRINHLRATMSLELTFVINDIIQRLRSKVKYEDLTDEEYKIYEEIREMIYEIMNNYNIKLDNLLQ